MLSRLKQKQVSEHTLALQKASAAFASAQHTATAPPPPGCSPMDQQGNVLSNKHQTAQHRIVQGATSHQAGLEEVELDAERGASWLHAVVSPALTCLGDHIKFTAKDAVVDYIPIHACNTLFSYVVHFLAGKGGAGSEQCA